MAKNKTLSGAGTLSLTWTRSDLPYELCFEYWRGPHGTLVGHNKSCFSYRQLHFDREMPKLDIPEWKVTQDCPKEWIPDGIAECLCTNLILGALSQKTKVAKLTFKDEQNAFERALLYTAMPGNAHFDVENSAGYEMNGAAHGERVAILFKAAGNKKPFKDFILKKLVPILKETPGIAELHSYVFAPYNENAWPGENMKHDHPAELQYDAGLVIGAKDKETLLGILKSDRVADCINENTNLVRLVHVFNIRLTLVMRYDNRATVAAVRGAQVCDVLMAANAQNQVSDEFIDYMFKRF